MLILKPLHNNQIITFRKNKLPVRANTQQAVQPNTNQTVQNKNNDVQNTQITDNRTYPFNRALRGMYKHGRREIRMEWNDGSRQWVTDDKFNDATLQYINSRFTTKGKMRRSCFKNRKF